MEQQEKSAMAVVLCGDRILATEEDIYGKVVLSLPKGHVENGESVAEAAVRECFEETGVVLRKESMLFEAEPFSYRFSDMNAVAVQKTVVPVVFVVGTVSATRVTEKRIKSANFMDISSFLARCNYQNVKNALQNILTRLEAEVSRQNGIQSA